MEVVVEQPWLDVEFHSVEVSAKGRCGGSEIGCCGRVEVQAVVEVGAPRGVMGGSGEPPEVGSAAQPVNAVNLPVAWAPRATFTRPDVVAPKEIDVVCAATLAGLGQGSGL